MYSCSDDDFLFKNNTLKNKIFNNICSEPNKLAKFNNDKYMFVD